MPRELIFSAARHSPLDLSLSLPLLKTIVSDLALAYGNVGNVVRKETMWSVSEHVMDECKLYGLPIYRISSFVMIVMGYKRNTMVVSG